MAKYTLPTRPVTFPRGVGPEVNGKLLTSQLVNVGPGGWFVPSAARAFNALRYAFEGEMLTKLTWTGTYRSYDAQVRLFRERYTDTPTTIQRMTSTSKKVWPIHLGGNGRTWYKYRGAIAAVPGTSNHGLGIAIDLAEEGYGAGAKNITDRSVRWLIEHAFEYGWSFETQSEPWHIRLVCGDNLPQKVLDIEAFFAEPTAPPMPPPAPPVPTPVQPATPPFAPEFGLWGDLPNQPIGVRPELDLGSGLDGGVDAAWVRYVKGVARKAGMPYIDNSGIYDPTIKAAVAELQKNPFINMYPDGRVTGDDWAWIDKIALHNP